MDNFLQQYDSPKPKLSDKQKLKSEDKQNLTPIIELLNNYAATVKFCTPSLPRYIREELGEILRKGSVEGSVSCENDIYFGNLSDNTGKYKYGQVLLADAYTVDAAIYGVNGSTGNNRSIMKYFATKGKTHLLSSRNIHKSIGIAASEYKLDISFLPINFDDNNELFIPNTADDIRTELKKHKDSGNPIDVVLLSNPTYEGFSTNIREISDVIKEHNDNIPTDKQVIFFVDEAWGAHLPFLPRNDQRLPKYSLHNGADINTISMHKQGGGLNQTAVIQIKGSLVNIEELYRIHHEITTTSPSPFLVGSIDLARKYLTCGEGRERLDYMVNGLYPSLREMLNNIKGIRTIDDSYLKQHSFLSMDLTKVVFNTRDTGLSAEYMSQRLINDYKISVEKKEDNCAILLLTFDTTHFEVHQLRKALLEIIDKQRKIKHYDSACFPRQVKKVLRPYIVEHIQNEYKETLLLNNSVVDRISAEDITLYPPGIPIIYKGEAFTKEHVDYFLNAQQRTVTKVARDKSLRTVYVLNRNGENYVK